MVFQPFTGDQAVRSDVSDRPQTFTTFTDKHSLVDATLADMRMLAKGGSQGDTSIPGFDLPGNVIRIDDGKDLGRNDKTLPDNVIRLDDGPSLGKIGKIPPDNGVIRIDDGAHLGPIDRTGPVDGKIGIPEETPSFKAYERLTAKLEKEFPGKENEEFRSAALAYTMNREGYHNYSPSLDQFVTLIQSGKLEALKGIVREDQGKSGPDPNPKYFLNDRTS